MFFILMAVIIILLSVIVIQYFLRRKTNRELYEICEKLAHIIEQESSEKLFIQSNQHVTQQLLIQVNRLLNYNQKVFAETTRSQESMRKMLSNVSHDLKTPLTVILGYTEKLKGQGEILEKEQHEAIERLHKKTLDVIALTEQFFDLAKLESGDSDFPISRLSINEICRKNILGFYHVLHSKGLRAEVDIPEQNYYIFGNEEVLNRILNNLISNAIQYGSDGGVIGITVRNEGEQIAVDIWDRGKGINEVHLNHVFERLYTMDDARNPEFQGSGLGLSITKRLTETLNGEIRLRSKPYEETVFTCTFKRIAY